MPRKKDHAAGLNGAVAAVLRGELRAARLRIRDLADTSGIDSQSLGRYLRTERAIDLEVLDKTSKALRLTAAEVVAAAADRLRRGVVDEDAAYTSVRESDPLGRGRTDGGPEADRRDTPKGA